MNFRLSGRTVFLAIWDVAAVYAALIIATLGTSQESEIFSGPDPNSWIFLFGIVALINIGSFIVFRLYNNLWEYASVSEVLQIVYATAVAMPVAAAIHYVAGERLPFRVYVIAWFILLVLVGVSRFFFRYWRVGKRKANQPAATAIRRRTLVIGAGETGSLTIKRMVDGDYSMQGYPVAAVDDDPTKRGMRINKVKVVGGTEMILDLVKTYAIEQIVVAIPSATPEQRKRIYDICIQTDCRLLTLPNVRDLRMDELDDVRLREVDLVDLLSRDEVKLNERMVAGYITGRKVLITGGGGSIGSELARQIATVAPSQIVVFDIYENTAYELELEMRDKYGDMDFRVEIGSVRDRDRLKAVFDEYLPEVVFHAAAHKHVPLMEANPREAV
ncbi:MAG TPA: nucleoside-diphosphate sugar epimerase, partial [Coriobacteriia bacterium]|nr:nucleoside-diphosphate sugar epimerase [Coriobacteriia bacterium]